MTRAPSPTPNHTAVSAGNGVATGGAGAPVLHIDDVTKTYPGEPPVHGLGAVALVVGAVGVANIMITSVLENRSEIGLRRALAATRGHIRTQFLSEAILLGLLGGAVGVALGVVSTGVYPRVKHWATVVPTEAWAGGITASVVNGVVAGLIPALRAARLSPTQPSGPSDPRARTLGRRARRRPCWPPGGIARRGVCDPHA